MEYKEGNESENKVKRKMQLDDSDYSDVSDSEETYFKDNEKEEFETVLSENIDLIKSENMPNIIQGIFNINECIKVHSEYIISVFDDILVLQIFIHFLDEVEPNITPIILSLLRIYSYQSEKQNNTDCSLMKIDFVALLVKRLEECIPYMFAIDILKTLYIIICSFPVICTNYMSSGLISRIMDILFNYVRERPPSRSEDQDKYAVKVEFTNSSIDITDNNDIVISTCIKIITAELLLNNEMTSYTTKECLDYIILFMFRLEYSQSSNDAILSFNCLLSHRNTYAYKAIANEFIKCDKITELLEMAFAGNINCWFSICDLFHIEEMKKEMCDKGSIEMIKNVLLQSHQIINESHNSEKEEGMEEIVNKAEEMRLLALSALNAATGKSNSTIVEQIISLEMLPLIIESIVEAPIKAKREACCIFSNLAIQRVVGDMLNVFPDFPLQLLQALNSLPNEEKIRVLLTVGDVIEFAIKSGEFDPLECVGGEEGHEIIEELLDTTYNNVYDTVVRINSLITSCLDTED